MLYYTQHRDRLYARIRKELVMAGNTVTGEQYMEIDGLMLELMRQLRQKGGYKHDVADLKRHLQLAVEGEFVKPRFKRDMAKERSWTLETEGPKHPEDVSVADLDLIEFFVIDEKDIEDVELEKRAKVLKANLGQHTAEYLLEHQSEIPEKWRGARLVFLGTVWRNSFANRSVPYLVWVGERWILSFDWLIRRFDSSNRLVGFSESSSSFCFGDAWPDPA